MARAQGFGHWSVNRLIDDRAVPDHPRTYDQGPVPRCDRCGGLYKGPVRRVPFTEHRSDGTVVSGFRCEPPPALFPWRRPR